MGIYSTMSITREDCVAKIREEINEVLLNGSDETLEDLLFEVWGREHLYNFRIVREYMPDGWLQYRNKNDSDDYRRGYEDAIKNLRK